MLVPVMCREASDARNSTSSATSSGSSQGDGSAGGLRGKPEVVLAHLTLDIRAEDLIDARGVHQVGVAVGRMHDVDPHPGRREVQRHLLV